MQKMSPNVKLSIDGEPINEIDITKFLRNEILLIYPAKSHVELEGLSRHVSINSLIMA